MKILFCSSEVAPYAKTGGLGDVAGSLPLALGKLGLQVQVITPKYRGIHKNDEKLSDTVAIHFVEHDSYFNRPGLYGDGHGDYPDNLRRFSYFCREALNWCQKNSFQPDIVHCHDWETALIPVFLKLLYANDPFFGKTKSLFTIHNISYQGVFQRSYWDQIGLDHQGEAQNFLKHFNHINTLKGALSSADALSTVSVTYAKEILHRKQGCGLQGVLRRRHDQVVGIVNGLDYDTWNPVNDAHIYQSYSSETISLKKINKGRFQTEYGLERDETTPLFGMVSRLVEQKGIGLLLASAEHFLNRPVQWALVGTGEKRYHAGFQHLKDRFGKKAVFFLQYDETLAQRVYAASDFLLMPSLFEPCGLSQMIGFRYGAIPVARHTGGLVDTVTDIDQDPINGNGFVFKDFKPNAFLKAVDRSLLFYKESVRREALAQKIMKLDYSWNRSAKEYLQLYQNLTSL